MTKRKEPYKLIPELTTEFETRIRFNECDPLGIVWHGHYIKYFEDGREAFGRRHGVSYLDVAASGYATPIVKSMCEHKLSLRYGDVCKIKTEFYDTAAAKIIFKFTIYDTDGNVACTGETIQVFIDQQKGELQLTNPPFWEDWKKRMGLI